MGERHRLLGRERAAAGLQDTVANDVQKRSFVKRRLDMRRNPPAACGGKAPVYIFQPGIGVDDLVVVVGFRAGGDATQESGSGGDRLAAEPADEAQRQLGMPG